MVYNGILMETIGISVMVSIGLLLFFFSRVLVSTALFVVKPVQYPTFILGLCLKHNRFGFFKSFRAICNWYVLLHYFHQ